MTGGEEEAVQGQQWGYPQKVIGAGSGSRFVDEKERGLGRGAGEGSLQDVEGT